MFNILFVRRKVQSENYMTCVVAKRPLGRTLAKLHCKITINYLFLQISGIFCTEM